MKNSVYKAMAEAMFDCLEEHNRTRISYRDGDFLVEKSDYMDWRTYEPLSPEAKAAQTRNKANRAPWSWSMPYPR